MAQPRVFDKIPGIKIHGHAPVMGETVIEIVIQTDSRGMMKTSITKYPLGRPPTQLQVLGILLDCMNGQFQGMIQAASMLVDPNGKGLDKGLPNGGEEKENDHGGRGDSGKPNGTG